MSRRRSSLAPAPPLDDDDLLEEILLRLPPLPSSLPRASLVCKRWRSIVSGPQFLSRFRKHHRKPPLLGFFSGRVYTTPIFNPVLDSPNRIPTARFSVPQSHRRCVQWRFMGCRHGLATLFDDYHREVIVWDPLTGQQHRVPFPPSLSNAKKESVWPWYAAVLCVDAEDGHVHGDCFFRPFKLVLIFGKHKKASACLYESASGVWGDIASTATNEAVLPIRPGILIRSAVYWSFYGGDILMFDIERQTLGVIKKPADAHITDYRSFQLVRTDDGSGLGFAYLAKLSIHLWERKINSDGVARWVLQPKIIKLDELFPRNMHSDHKKTVIVGYDEESNVIILATYIADFMLQLESMRFRRFSDKNCWDNKLYYPYTSFYAAERGVGWKGLDLKL